MRFRTIARILSMLEIAALTQPLYLWAQEEAEVDSTAKKPTLTEFDPPGAGTAAGEGAEAFAISNLGDITGDFIDSNNIIHGFTRSRTGAFATLDAPGSGLQNKPANPSSGHGPVWHQQPRDSGRAPRLEQHLFHGFIRSAKGTFTTIDAADAGTGANQGTLAFDINSKSETAGIYTDQSNGTHGFARQPSGKITEFDAPNADATKGGTGVCQVKCLNARGEITGFYVDTNGIFHGFLREPDGMFSGFDPPAGATLTVLGTQSTSINDRGVVVGVFLDSNNVFHSFIRSSNGAFQTFDDPTPGQTATQAIAINSLGTITGGRF
jgi:hypothetical protein